MVPCGPRPYVVPVQVLICDDESHVRLAYRAAFESEGVDVTEAVDGDDCLEQLAAATAPTSSILDLYMPDRDGLSTLPGLRQRCSTAPVLIVSAHDAGDTFAACRQRGATACFDKLSFVARIPRIVEHYGALA